MILEMRSKLTRKEWFVLDKALRLKLYARRSGIQQNLCNHGLLTSAVIKSYHLTEKGSIKYVYARSITVKGFDALMTGECET